ncbi:hypothetical protein ACFT79_22920 [[Kitasatospora] papulosa]|uniref:hypothetical protein n=1 Tax=[Kitasatospora] papulosa TaxID=1464011 RepID=UPI00364170B1
MRSARTLFASAAVTAVLAVSVPAAYAVTSADDWNKDSGSSASSNDDREKPDSWKHEKPEGGVHTGGGALAGVSVDDWQKDKDEDKESGSGSNDDREKPDSWKHEKPEGGVHAGGGALAGVTADDWQKDKGEDKESGSGSDSEGEKTWKHEKPEGGVHTGGGAMALSGSGLAAGSVLMLGGLGAAAYKLRRRNASGATAA